MFLKLFFVVSFSDLYIYICMYVCMYLYMCIYFLHFVSQDAMHVL